MRAIKSILVSALLVALSSLATLLLANFLLVYFAAHAMSQSNFPRALINSLDGCYQTFYPATRDKTLDRWVAVVGDSHGAGEGDEFLAGARDYGLFHKLRQLDGQNYLIFARGGFGSTNAARELVQCLAFMNGSWLFGKIEPPRKIIVLFYEGNDLNDNIRHLATMAPGADLERFVGDEIATDFDWRRTLAIYFPLYRILIDSGRAALRDPAAAAHAELGADAANADNHVALTQGNARVPLNPQSAAVELSPADTQNALAVFYASVTRLQRHFPAAEIQLVYLPAVVTVYDWTEPIRVQAYHSRAAVTTTADNLQRSTQLRRDIERFAQHNGHGFVDPTAALRRLAQERLLHGPKDWKHFNRLGYQALADALAAQESALATRRSTTFRPD